MKTRFVWVVLGVIAVAGLWFGRLAWRAHEKLVTLDVNNAPLGEVVRAMERQTREKIRYDKKLNAKITIHVKNVPLERALDLVAEKAGARWQETFAVAASPKAFEKLEQALDGAAKLEAVGWTNLAPKFPDVTQVDLPEAGAEGAEPGRILQRVFRGGSDGQKNGAEGVVGSGPVPAAGGMRTITVMPDGTTDQWSAERLVIDAILLRAMKGGTPAEATPESAASIAAEARGRARLYYTLAPSPGGMRARGGGMASGPRKRILRGDPGGGAPGSGDIVATIKAEQQQARLRELSLSPEEQVERARQHANTVMSVQTFQRGEPGTNDQ